MVSIQVKKIEHDDIALLTTYGNNLQHLFWLRLRRQVQPHIHRDVIDSGWQRVPTTGEESFEGHNVRTATDVVVLQAFFNSRELTTVLYESYARRLVFLTLSCEHDVVIFDFRLELVQIGLTCLCTCDFWTDMLILGLESLNKTSFMKIFNYNTLSLRERRMAFAIALAILITGASQSRQHDTLVRLPMDIRLKIDLGKSVGSHKSPTKSLFDVGSSRISIFNVNT
ncbi:hypothetical protein Tco_0588884 [Tanacetum coccineum]